MGWEIRRSRDGLILLCDGAPVEYGKVDGSVEEAAQAAKRRGALHVVDWTKDEPDERGSIMFYVLGLTMVVMLFAGLCIDVWRAISVERALATAVDAAAAAGANGLDEDAYRRDGTVQLNPARAEDLAAQSLAAQPEAPTLSSSDVSATTERVTVRAETDVQFTLVRIFMPGGFSVSASADASPESS